MRHFGLSRRPEPGVCTRGGSHTAQNATRAANVIPILAPASRSTGTGQSDTRSGGAGYGKVPVSFPLPAGSLVERGEPGFDERELGAGFIFFAVPLFSLLFVLSVVVGYAAFVSQAVQN